MDSCGEPELTAQLARKAQTLSDDDMHAGKTSERMSAVFLQLVKIFVGSEKEACGTVW